jgi:DNA replication protein DnaC
MTDPTIVTVTHNDPDVHEDVLERAAERAKAIPKHYRNAVVDVPEVAAWVTGLVHQAKSTRGAITTGPSLLLVGVTGTGKTHQAYGALRALSVSGVSCRWRFTAAADLYAWLRPRHGMDSEVEFARYMSAGLLVLDDLGAAKPTEWNEEINLRLINHRYEHELPMLITSNVPPKDLAHVLGERVASRLSEMATRVVLRGSDRRRNGAA